MNYKVWIKTFAMVIFSAGWLASANLQAAPKTSEGYSIDAYSLLSANDLVSVCSIEQNHPDYGLAIAFCYGFFEGAEHYDNAMSKAEWHDEIACIPDGVTRSDGVAIFVEYMNANPQYGSEPPVDAIFRALVTKWPCDD